MDELRTLVVVAHVTVLCPLFRHFVGTSDRRTDMHFSQFQPISAILLFTSSMNWCLAARNAAAAARGFGEFRRVDVVHRDYSHQERLLFISYVKLLHVNHRSVKIQILNVSI